MLRKSSKTIELYIYGNHNLPRCMLKKGYPDKSYVHNISEAECVDYSLSNMDQELKDRIFNLI